MASSDRSVVRLNGLREVDIGWLPMEDGQPWTVPASQPNTTRGPGLMGQVATGQLTGQPRQVPLSLRTESPVVGDRREAVDRLMGQLDGLVEVEWADEPGRVRLCRVEGVEIRGESPESSWTDAAGHLRATVQLVEDEAVAFSLQPSILSVGTDPVTPDLGTAPSAPRFIFAGPFSELDIVLRSSSGALLTVLEIGEVEPDEYVEIDCGTDVSPYIVRGDATGREVDWSLLVGGSFPILDPGDRPTIEATESGVMYYRQAWR